MDVDRDTKDHNNPYAAGVANGVQPLSAAVFQSRHLLTNGERLRCKPPVVLPRYCVVSGTTNELMKVTRNLTRQSMIQIWGALPILLLVSRGAVVPGVIAAFWIFFQLVVVPKFLKSCSVTYWVNREILQRRRIQVITLYCVLCVSYWASFIRAFQSMTLEWMLFSGIPLVVIAVIADRMRRGPVRLAGFGRGEIAILIGFNAEFLQRVRQLPDEDSSGQERVSKGDQPV